MRLVLMSVLISLAGLAAMRTQRSVARGSEGLSQQDLDHIESGWEEEEEEEEREIRRVKQARKARRMKKPDTDDEYDAPFDPFDGLLRELNHNVAASLDPDDGVMFDLAEDLERRREVQTASRKANVDTKKRRAPKEETRRRGKSRKHATKTSQRVGRTWHAEL